jgi:PPOX class probable F420-dependent enzyme
MPRTDRLSPGAVQLLKEKQIAIVSTLMPDGSIQSTPTWVDAEDDGSHVLINTVMGHLKARNINRDPRVSIAVVDYQNSWRTVMVRGTIEEQLGPDRGATEHIHKMAQKYMGREQYPLREGEQRVILRIKPTHVMERGTEDEPRGNRWRERGEGS